MSSFSLRGYLNGLLDQGAYLYTKDLEALPDAESQAGPRNAIDFTHEVSVVNRRIAARIRREDPGAWPFEGWAKAPADRATKAAAIEDIGTSVADLKDALDGLADEQLTELMPMGEKESTPMEQVVFACVHMAYHMGQLNYIQQLAGDMEVHWD
jgi:hypothetical protein